MQDNNKDRQLIQTPQAAEQRGKAASFIKVQPGCLRLGIGKNLLMAKTCSFLKTSAPQLEEF